MPAILTVSKLFLIFSLTFPCCLWCISVNFSMNHSIIATATCRSPCQLFPLPITTTTVPQAAHMGHLVYTLGTLGQCKAQLLRSLKAWRTCTTCYWQVYLLNWWRERDTMPNEGAQEENNTHRGKAGILASVKASVRKHGSYGENDLSRQCYWWRCENQIGNNREVCFRLGQHCSC